MTEGRWDELRRLDSRLIGPAVKRGACRRSSRKVGNFRKLLFPKTFWLLRWVEAERKVSSEPYYQTKTAKACVQTQKYDSTAQRHSGVEILMTILTSSGEDDGYCLEMLGSIERKLDYTARVQITQEGFSCQPSAAE